MCVEAGNREQAAVCSDLGKILMAVDAKCLGRYDEVFTIRVFLVTTLALLPFQRGYWEDNGIGVMSCFVMAIQTDGVCNLLKLVDVTRFAAVTEMRMYTRDWAGQPNLIASGEE